jgi:hypothetical protein
VSPASTSRRPAASANAVNVEEPRGTLKSPATTAGSAGSSAATRPASVCSSVRAIRVYRLSGDQSPSRLADRWVLTTASAPPGVSTTANCAPLRMSCSVRGGPVIGYGVKPRRGSGHRDSSIRPPLSSGKPVA